METLAVKLKLILLTVDHSSNAELYVRLQPYENWQSGVQTRQKMYNALWPFLEMTNKSDTAISNSAARTWSFITSLSREVFMITYYCLCLSASTRCRRLSTLNMLGGQKMAGILIYVTDSG